MYAGRATHRIRRESAFLARSESFICFPLEMADAVRNQADSIAENHALMQFGFPLRRGLQADGGREWLPVPTCFLLPAAGGTIRRGLVLVSGLSERRPGRCRSDGNGLRSKSRISGTGMDTARPGDRHSLDRNQVCGGRAAWLHPMIAGHSDHRRQRSEAMVDPVAWYDANAESVLKRYEGLSSVAVHGWLLDLLPKASAAVLDVGAGSGRDSAWFASCGHDVVAVEPSVSMRQAAASLHADVDVRWTADRLPDLTSVLRTGLSFDVILMSAVWMHLPEVDRPRAFRKVMNLLKPGGLLAISLRCGPEDRERGIHSVSLEEIEALARDHGAFVEREAEQKDRLGRPEVRWINVAIRLPDDGTGALPLLRHIILNDDKSSTYKLALLRTLGRIADGSAGLARDHDDGHVAVPLGLVALAWIRLFKPLLAAGFPQNPRNVGLSHLGFVKDGFRRLAGTSHLDLRIGMSFSDVVGSALHSALRDAAATIERMPASHMTYPGGDPVFPVRRVRGMVQPTSRGLDQAYLSSFGELLVPRHLWRALQRFDVWVEPAIVAEWSRLIGHYATRLGMEVDAAKLAAAMTWEESVRDVRVARERALQLAVDGNLHCVWSGRSLDSRSLDIDHCLPWTAWPCNDLWNLMPAHRSVNQGEKRARLPAGAILRTSQDRVMGWWETAYVKWHPPVSNRFWIEARSSLPGANIPDSGLGDVFEALCFQRIRLKDNQQVPEWSGERHAPAGGHRSD